ncbi:MAG: hypothetical protein ACK4ZR_00755, partial [Aquificaceae bacterium]
MIKTKALWCLLVLLLVGAMSSFANAQASKWEEFFDPNRRFVDLLHGFSVQLKEGWDVRILGNSIVIRNTQDCYIQVRGVNHKGNLRQVVQRWSSERQMMDTTRARFAFRQTKQGIIIVGEGLGFPHPLSPMSSVNAGLLGMPLPNNFREVSVILPGRTMALVVSFLFPEGTREETRREMVEIVQSFKFLPPKEMVSWREEVIVDPEVGIEAVRMHVPKDFEFQGTVAIIGTKRTPLYIIRKGQTMLRQDSIDLSTQVVQSGYMSSGKAILNINGRASEQPQPIWINEPEDTVKLLASIWKAITGKDWQIVKIVHLPKSESEERMKMQMKMQAEQGLAAMGAIARYDTLKLAYIIQSEDLVQMGIIFGSLLNSQSPHPVAATQSSQLSMLVKSFQFRKGEEEKAMGIFSGILASEYISPRFA